MPPETATPVLVLQRTNCFRQDSDSVDWIQLAEGRVQSWAVFKPGNEPIG
jgi:hypothetical protein